MNPKPRWSRQAATTPESFPAGASGAAAGAASAAGAGAGSRERERERERLREAMIKLSGFLFLLSEGQPILGNIYRGHFGTVRY